MHKKRWGGIGILIIAATAIWGTILTTYPATHDRFYFLNVGQGDSALLELNVGRHIATILIDGGKPGASLSPLGKALPFGERHIDLVIFTHPDLDHAGGIIDVLENYDVGLLLGTGRGTDTAHFRELVRLVKEKHIPFLQLEAYDRIRVGSRVMDIISPDRERLHAKTTNDSSIVSRYRDGDFSILYTGDISWETERLILDRGITADVLKVPHHGSKYSSSAEFLAVVQPKIAVISVGKNSYGHPTTEALGRLKAAGAQIIRTDEAGTIRIEHNGSAIFVSTERE